MGLFPSECAQFLLHCECFLVYDNNNVVICKNHIDAPKYKGIVERGIGWGREVGVG